jgi:malonyl-CoA O-methyltransferase
MFSWIERLTHRGTELSVDEAYARWAPNYPPRAFNKLMELEEGAFLELLPDVKGRTVLDLACGSGRYLKILLERGASPAVGLDASAPMLCRARSVSPDLVQADLLSLSLRPEAFHLVACALAVGHVKDLRRAMLEIRRVLAPEGFVIYSDFHPLGSMLGWRRTFRVAGGREHAVSHFTHLYSDHVAACSAAGLRIEEVREPRINFGEKWRGYPAVLVFRARRTD